MAIKEDNQNELALAYENLGWAYYLLKDYEKAKENIYKAIEICKVFNKKKSLTNNFCNLGLVYMDQDSLLKAEKFILESLILGKEIQHNWIIFYDYTSFGMIADKRKDFIKAWENYQNALAIIEEIPDYDQGYAYSKIANHYYLRKNYNESLKYADSVMGIAEKLHSSELAHFASENYYKVYAALNQFELAYNHKMLYDQYKDSIKEFEANQLGLVYEFNQTIKENEIKEEQKDIIQAQQLKQQKLIRNIFILGFVLLILLMILILRNFLQKKKANELLCLKQAEIEEKNKELYEQKEEILTANEELQQQQEEIQTINDSLRAQNEEINSQREAITDSIQYASRIQKAILPPETYITELLHENFIFNKPRDIVSGDFYWVKQVNQYIVIVAADCTGHGVPGAFMSMLGISYLNEIVQKREITQANQVLNELRKQIKHSLRQHGMENETKDGMDIALCVIDTKTNKMEYAGAYNPLYLIRDVDGKPELLETKADRMPVGFNVGLDKSFTNHEIKLEIGDTFYIFSDGFIDQFGGSENKKYMSQNFKKLLLEIHARPMYEQKNMLDKTLSDWMGENEQMDDILVIGVRV